MNKIRLASVAVLALVLSAFVPLQTAPATAVDATFTKTFTVMGPDGNPYAGAQVALIEGDDANHLIRPTTPVTTNSSGEAVVTASVAGNYWGFSVQPPATDTTTALFTGRLNGVTKSDEDIEVDLVTANLRVNLITSTGASAPAGSTITIPSSQVNNRMKTTITVRSGLTAVAVSTSIPSSRTYEIGIGANTDMSWSSRYFAMEVSGTGSNSTRTLHVSDSVSSAVLSPVSGVYTLQLPAEQIRGTLKTFDNQAVTLPSSAKGRVVVTPYDDEGNLDTVHTGPDSSLFNSDGTFTFGLPLSKVGRYSVQVFMHGSADFPNFFGPDIWLDASGNYSMTSGGTYASASTFVYDLRIPDQGPNFVIKLQNADGSAAASGIYVSNTSDGTWIGPGETANGIAAFAFDDGTYVAQIQYVNREQVSPFNEIQITVSGGIATVRNQGTIVPATSAETWIFSAAVPNLKLQIVNPSNPNVLLPQANIEILAENGEYVQSSWSNDGLGRLRVSDGSYQLKINTPENATYASRTYSLTVDGTSIAVLDENNTAVATSAGEFIVSPRLSNAIFRVVSPTDNNERLIQPNISLRVPNGEGLGGTGSYDSDLGVFIPEGVFELSVNAHGSGYASNTYSVTRAGSTISITNSAGEVIAPANGVYLVSPSTPNVKFKIVDPGNQGTSLTSAHLDIVDFNTQQFVAFGDMWSGVAGLNVPDGKFTVRVYPGNDAAGLAQNTYVLEMDEGQPTLKTQSGVTLMADNDGVFFVEPQSANVTLNIKHPTTQVALNYSHVQVFELDEARNFRDWVTFGNAQNGTAGLSLPDGTYGIEVQAGGNGDSTLAQNRYELTVSGGIATELKTWAGVSVTPESDGSFVVSPKTANLLLKVVNPDSPTQIVRGAYIDIRDSTNNWLPGGGVNNSGQVGVNVDDGTYTLTVNPGGQSSGLASKTYNLVVSNGGENVVVSSGSTALVKDPTTSVFTVSPASANVKLQVVDPSDGVTLLDQANASLFRAVGNERRDWLAHSNGTNPGFAVGNGSYIVEINAHGNDDFASQLYKITVAGSVVTVTTMANVAVTAVNNVFAVSPATANVALTVINPNTNEPLQNTWVEVFDRETNRWIAGNGSNRGNVGLNLPEGSYTVKVNPSGGGALAAKTYDMDVSANLTATVTGAPVVEGRIQLAVAAANVKLKTVSPSNPNTVLPYAHVSVHNADDNMWVTGVGGNTGLLALRLENGNYNLELHPGDVVGELLARKTYRLTVSNSGSTLAMLDSADQAVTAGSDGVFILAAALPAITGVVEAPDDAAEGGFALVENSWVELFNNDTEEHMWQNSSSTNQLGRFGIAVPEGSYSLSAQVPWNSGYNLAKSAPCSVDVGSGAITSAVGGCVVQVGNQKSVQLRLRAPNVSFIVADSEGTPLPNAHVSLHFGGWQVWANANDEGRVSMFVDKAEIVGKNPDATGVIDLRAYIEPPYGSTTSVRYECSEGVGTLCSKLAPIDLDSLAAFEVVEPIGTVRLLAPNTRITVVGPNSASIGEGAWVTLFKDGQNGRRDWIGGSNTGSNGQAVFNVTDTTGTFTIEVNAPHGKRGLYASKTYSGLSFADLNGSSRALATPNLKLKVQQPGTNKAAKWSWVNVERINDQFNPTAWVPGASTDDFGIASAFLDADGKYRLTIYPGGGSVGARTVCDVEVASGVVSLIAGRCNNGVVSVNGFTITLSRGNLTGVITAVDDSTPLAGAIVVAERVDASMGDQQFTTGVDGTYGFQLAQGDWKIKVYYVNEPGSQLAPDLTGTVININGPGDFTHDKTLTVVGP
jgi:hypothetical protein